MKKVCLSISAAICIVACSVSQGAYAAIEHDVPTMAVLGTGKVTAQPDEATTVFRVRSEEPSLASAFKYNTQDMNAAINTLKSMGIKKEDMTTSSYVVRPIYPTDEKGNRKPEKPVLFRVEQQLTVKIRDLSMVGNVIDKVVENGVNVFDSLGFSSSKMAELQKEARVKSAKDAKERASLLAEGL